MALPAVACRDPFLLADHRLDSCFHFQRLFNDRRQSRLGDHRDWFFRGRSTAGVFYNNEQFRSFLFRHVHLDSIHPHQAISIFDHSPVTDRLEEGIHWFCLLVRHRRLSVHFRSHPISASLQLQLGPGSIPDICRFRHPVNTHPDSL